MNRLTDYDEKGLYLKHMPAVYMPAEASHTLTEAVKKLAAYEDAEEQGLLAPVRHGQWIKHYIEAPDPHDRYNWQCSICETYSSNQTNYCPNCGARMDGE